MTTVISGAVRVRHLVIITHGHLLLDLVQCERVDIDETWIKVNMASLRFWRPRGKRLRCLAPHQRT